MPLIPEIELRGVTSFRGGYEALRDVNLSLMPGEALFAMGGAGSSKSVLLKTAAGIALPGKGEIFYKGKPLSRMSTREESAFRKASGFAFQDAALWANQSLYDNLALPVRLHEPRWGKAEVERAVKRAAALVGYDHELRVRPAELSSGERKLIGFARALVLDPELLFLDDPISGLDEASASGVSDIIEALKARGRSIFVASAVSELATRCADSIAVLLGGSLAAHGTYTEAVTWTDTRVRAITGRLKSRGTSVPVWAGGLAGAWVAALAEDSFIVDAAALHSGLGGMSALGDIINDVPDLAAGSDSDRKERE